MTEHGLRIKFFAIQSCLFIISGFRRNRRVRSRGFGRRKGRRRAGQASNSFVQQRRDTVVTNGAASRDRHQQRVHGGIPTE